MVDPTGLAGVVPRVNDLQIALLEETLRLAALNLPGCRVGNGLLLGKDHTRGDTPFFVRRILSNGGTDGLKNVFGVSNIGLDVVLHATRWSSHKNHLTISHKEVVDANIIPRLD